MSDTDSSSNSASLSIYDQSKHTACDECGQTSRITTLHAFPGNKPVQIRYFKIPAEYDRLCSSCFETANEHTIDDMTEDELIAGIISDSFGYATPDHALRHITDHKNGEDHCHCERGRAHFDNDLSELLEAARRRWLSRSADEKQSLLDTVSGWRDVEETDEAAALGLSMAYPSHAPELTARATTDTSTTPVDMDALSPQELQSTLFMTTDSLRFFTIDTLPNNDDEMAVEYLHKRMPSYKSVSDVQTMVANAQLIEVDTIEQDPLAFKDTFLTPTKEDIRALRSTIQRSNHPPSRYLQYFLSLKLAAGDFDAYL